jgi:hypothetical protein
MNCEFGTVLTKNSSLTKAVILGIVPAHPAIDEQQLRG